MRTGTLTRPKLIEPVQIARGGMCGVFPCFATDNTHAMKRTTAVAAAGAAAAAVTAGVVATKLRKDTPLDELSKAELYDRAKAADIPGRSGMSKDELIAALSG